ncbi:MAG: NosD protein [Osedax symbiont Rs2]|nr:MAG: NosD protein [Osedax symbiont Rs2]
MTLYNPVISASLLLLLAVFSRDSYGQIFYLTPTDNLQQILDKSLPGDKVQLAKGRYFGNFVMPQSIELAGDSGAIIDSQGAGHALVINAADSYVHHLQLQNWGSDLTTMDAAIFIAKEATNTRVEQNHISGGGFGIWVDGTRAAKVIGNQIVGNNQLRSTDRGNGIHLYNVTSAMVKDNKISSTRDGIYIESSNKNQLINNQMQDLRYGIHYMYSYHNSLINNTTINTRTGYALMQSKYLTVVNNRSINDVNYGMLLNYITYSKLQNNHISGVQNRRNPQMGKSTGRGLEGKALFIYNSLFNEFSHNQFSDSDIGIHLTAGSENNQLFNNAFINNKTQVKYVSSRGQDWSGNYWSDYLGWDMDGDGIGDALYEPNDNVDRLLWKFPAARLLFNSPAIRTLQWVQTQFPVLKGSGVVDSAPLMKLPEKLQLGTSISKDSPKTAERSILKSVTAVGQPERVTAVSTTGIN